LEIEFLSGDNNQEAYDEYFATMPWTSSGYNKDRYRELMDKFGLRGIPSLILVDKNENALKKDCRGDVMSAGLQAIAAWKKLVDEANK